MASVIVTGSRQLLHFSSKYARNSLKRSYREYVRLMRDIQRPGDCVDKVAVSNRPSSLRLSISPSVFFSSSENHLGNSTSFDYPKICDETLDSLCEYFEDLVDTSTHLTAADVTYGDGVLTVNFGNSLGTYVINRQSPNRQIWLSSPTSGPKRYDYEVEKNAWIYKHSNESLHQLLQNEIPKIVNHDVDFFQCAYSGKNSR